MRLWPRSISGQLLGLWTLAILAAHLFAVLLLSLFSSDNRTLHPLSVRAIEARVATGYHVLAHAPDPQQLLDDLRAPGATFELNAGPPAWADGDSPQEQALVRELRQQLALGPRLPIRLRLRQDPPVPAQSDQSTVAGWFERLSGASPPWVLEVAIARADGQWLYSRQHVTMIPPHWKRVLSFSLLVGLVPSAVIALLFGHWLMRPLRRLTDASRRVSRGEPVVLPQVRGPADVREITQAFNEMQESLLRFVNGRTQMIAAIGHDLRTPLTSLRIRAELIDDDALRRDMTRTLDEMGVIVEETLQFAREDELHEPVQDVALGTIVAEVLDAQRMRGHEVDWRSSAALDMGLRCRPVLLKRALGNLIDNAARYGRVQVASETDPAARTLLIQIDDQGPGIPTEHMERMFEPFSRLDSARNRDTGGLGLGLAIARSCIRAHGGDIRLGNRDNGGLRASIRLPL